MNVLNSTERSESFCLLSEKAEVLPDQSDMNAICIGCQQRIEEHNEHVAHKASSLVMRFKRNIQAKLSGAVLVSRRLDIL